jgi:hypothetical protein
MAVSVGLDSEAYIPRRMPALETTAPVAREWVGYDLVGRSVAARWRMGGGEISGTIVAVDRVFLSESLRLVILKPDGLTQRVYTHDQDWDVRFS